MSVVFLVKVQRRKMAVEKDVMHCLRRKPWSDTTDFMSRAGSGKEEGRVGESVLEKTGCR